MTFDVKAARAAIAARGDCAGPMTTFPTPTTAHVTIICPKASWPEVILWLDLCVKQFPEALARIEQLERDRDAAIDRVLDVCERCQERCPHQKPGGE